MDSQPWPEQLRADLHRQGLPLHYIDRLVEELDDRIPALAATPGLGHRREDFWKLPDRMPGRKRVRRSGRPGPWKAGYSELHQTTWSIGKKGKPFLRSQSGSPWQSQIHHQ